MLNHDIVIILDRISTIKAGLNGAQPETDQWDALETACQSVHAAAQTSGYTNAQKNRMHGKLHDVEDFVTAAPPYDMDLVVVLTDELNGML